MKIYVVCYDNNEEYPEDYEHYEAIFDNLTSAMKFRPDSTNVLNTIWECEFKDGMAIVTGQIWYWDNNGWKING